MAVASSTAGPTASCPPTSSAAPSAPNTSAPMTISSQSQPVQNVVASTPMTHQVIAQQQMQLPASSSGPTYITPTSNTHTVRSNYKPIAPAPPQQQQQQQTGLITMAPQSNTCSDNKTDQQPQMLTIGYGSIGVTGSQGIRPTYQLPVSMGGGELQGSGGMINLQLSSGPTSCYITSPPVTSMSRMTCPTLPAGMITMSPAPLSAMANMTPQSVAQSSCNLQSYPTTSTPGPRMSIPPMQPVTVTVPAVSAPQFTLPPPPPPKADEAKKEEKSLSTPKKNSDTNEEMKKDATTTMTNGHHSPAVRDRNKEPGLPQAVVRPQILTHVLGDFVIQESSEPFPVGRFNTNDPLNRTNGHKIHENGTTKLDGEPPSKFIFICYLVAERLVFSFLFT